MSAAQSYASMWAVMIFLKKNGRVVFVDRAIFVSSKVTVVSDIVIANYEKMVLFFLTLC